MKFKDSKGIFQQIADTICDKILSKEYKTGDKIPSVRELASKFGVNHNTIMRTYMELQHKDIITNRRGVGYFVKENAHKKIWASRRNEFFQATLPEFIHFVDLLNIKKADVKELIKKLEENEKK